MIVLRGCQIPDDLYFDVERDVWVRFEPDGLATLGMTDIAQTRCGKLVNLLFKKPGKLVKRDMSAATIESAKWVGPFPMPFSGEIVAVNEDGFRRDILLANKDPYGAGWLVQVRPTDYDPENTTLLTGAPAVEAYQKRIAELQISCLRCIDEAE